MAIINKTGITNGGTIQAEHITRVIDALSGVSTDTLILSGSMTGSLIGTLTGTASFATSASRAVSSSFATTASFALNAGSGVTINNNTSGFLVTATGTAGTLNGETRMRFDGNSFSVGNGARTVDFKDLAGGSGLVLPLTQPSSPVLGSTYFHGDSGTLYIYGNSGWLTVQLT